jgi:hypothetical protein
LTAGIPTRHAPRVKARNLEPDDDTDLPPAEVARDRRRDHDLRAVEREGMRTGLAKQFKQVLDAQVKRGREADDDARLGEERSRTSKSPRRPHGSAGRPLA